MKIGVVVVNRNDGYKDFERGLIHFKSMLDTFDEVNYIDWNSPKGSYLWEIENHLPKTGKVKHFIIPPEIVEQIIKAPNAQQCNEGLSRNIGIRRSDCDWVISTNLDIIPPKREDLEQLISNLDPNIFYTVSRREAPKDIVYKHGHENWEQLREELYNTIPERHFPAMVSPNDNFSLINCCGDFQLAHKNVWDKIKGFEEEMVYACFVDTNVQKKSTLYGFNLQPIYDIPLYHMSHTGMGNDGSSPSKQKYNDPYYWVEYFEESENGDNWGLNNIEIEYEVI